MSATASVSFAQNVFPSTGNAGIGTTTPDTKLVIQANSADGLISFWNSGSSKKAYLGTAVATNQMIPGSSSDDLIIRAENQKILFSADAGSTAHFSLNANGDVGIGTVSPVEKLQVSTSGVSPQFVISQNNWTGSGASWYLQSVNSKFYIGNSTNQTGA